MSHLEDRPYWYNCQHEFKSWGVEQREGQPITWDLLICMAVYDFSDPAQYLGRGIGLGELAAFRPECISFRRFSTHSSSEWWAREDQSESGDPWMRVLLQTLVGAVVESVDASPLMVASVL